MVKDQPDAWKEVGEKVTRNIWDDVQAAVELAKLKRSFIFISDKDIES